MSGRRIEHDFCHKISISHKKANRSNRFFINDKKSRRQSRRAKLHKIGTQSTQNEKVAIKNGLGRRRVCISNIKHEGQLDQSTNLHVEQHTLFWKRNSILDRTQLILTICILVHVRQPIQALVVKNHGELPATALTEQLYHNAQGGRKTVRTEWDNATEAEKNYISASLMRLESD